MKSNFLVVAILAATLFANACGEDRKDERTKPGQNQNRQTEQSRNADDSKISGNKGEKREAVPSTNSNDATLASDLPPLVQNPAAKAFCGEFKLNNAVATADRPWTIRILEVDEGDRLKVELNGGSRHVGIFTMLHSKIGDVDNYEFSWLAAGNSELFRVYKYQDGRCLAQYKYTGYTEEFTNDRGGMISWYSAGQ